MADVLLFHHAHGLTEGVHAFAARLREEGHHVTTPDLYGGRVFDDLGEGVAYAQSRGMDAIIAAGAAVAEDMPAGLVYAGFSLGALPAQMLAQTRSGARAALLYHAGEPAEAFGTWPHGVPLQLHYAEADPWVETESIAELERAVEGAEVYVYPGSAHLFTDASLAAYDETTASLVLGRSLRLLDALD